MGEAVVCPGCGCAVEEVKAKAPEASYDDAVKGAATTNIVSAIICAVAIICWLLINMWVGAILCLVAEFIALMPNSKLNKAFKQNGLTTGDKKEMKAKRKVITDELKAKYPAYKLSIILGIVALVLLIIFVMFI